MKPKYADLQFFICPNPECRRELELREASAGGAETSLRCVCGTPMKKPYREPVIYSLTAQEAEERLGTTPCRR